MKTGRPRIEFDDKDWKYIEGMCLIQCTQAEIANVMKVSVDTLNARIKETTGLSFPEYYKRYADQGKMSLRRMQWRTAEKGNATMQIWLGKQYLGQSDKSETLVNEIPQPIYHKIKHGA